MNPSGVAAPAAVRPGETPEQALRRIERRADYGRVIGTDAGQALLAECARRAAAARKAGAR